MRQINVTLPAMVVLLALSACGDSKERDLAACENEAVKLYPNWRDNNGALAVDMGDFTYRCMKAKGYAFASDACPPGGGWASETMEHCYRKSWPWNN
jgi:hypothetical protein